MLKMYCLISKVIQVGKLDSWLVQKDAVICAIAIVLLLLKLVIGVHLFHIGILIDIVVVGVSAFV